MRHRRFSFILRAPDTGAGSAEANPPDSPAAPAGEAELPETILTAPPEGEKPEPEEDKPGQNDAKPDNPEGYALSFAEGTEVDRELLGQFRKTAYELGLTKGQAQKVAELYAGNMAGLGQKFEEAQNRAINDYINTRNAEFEKRPNFREEIVLARKAMMEFGDPDLIDVFRSTAMGSHPAMYEFMVKVGRALGEPGFKGQPGGPAEAPLHERIYGKDGTGFKAD